MGFGQGVEVSLTEANCSERNARSHVELYTDHKKRGKMKIKLKGFNEKIAASICSAILLTIMQSSASIADTTLQGNIEGWENIQQSTTVDQSCLDQITPQAPNASEAELERICTVTTVVKSKDETTHTAAIGARALALAPVKSKTWEINKIGITYFEVAKGKFYYDGAKAWSTQSYRGYKGYFDCQAAGSWGITVQVTVEDCTSTSVFNGAAVVDRETYKVSAFYAGFPVYWVYAMSQLSKADGTTTTRDF